jgi:hypothetical protein
VAAGVRLLSPVGLPPGKARLRRCFAQALERGNRRAGDFERSNAFYVAALASLGVITSHNIEAVHKEPG